MTATDSELLQRGFVAVEVLVNTLNIDHPDNLSRGPFCRIIVKSAVPTTPGVYAWCQNSDVMYIGKAGQLRQIVQGVSMNRAYNDYTYIPKSKVLQESSPRVRVNGLLNRALCEGSKIGWWWKEVDSLEIARQMEARLIQEWSPPWNRARLVIR